MLGFTIIFFLVVSIAYSIFFGDISTVSNALSISSGRAVELVIQLAGAMALWGGVMEVASRSGLTKKINKIISKVLRIFLKDIDPKGKAMQAISMNVTANILGLGNAATPLGITAMKELVKEENAKGTTRNIAFLILLNTASIQILPVTVSTIRLKYGSIYPWDCIVPVLLNSIISITIGCMAVYVLFSRRKKKNEAFRYNSSNNNYSGIHLWGSEKS